MRAMVATARVGSWPMAVSPESMTALEPSNTALAMSEVSARVGEGADTIDSSIWVAVMAGFPRAMQRCRIIFWRCGQLLEGHLRTEVATGHHHRPGRLDDAVEVLDRGPGLDLGDDHGPGRVGLGADPADVVGRAHEGHRDHVGPLVDEGVEQPEVVGGRGGQAQPLRGDVDAGAALEQAAVDHPGPEPVGDGDR